MKYALYALKIETNENPATSAMRKANVDFLKVTYNVSMLYFIILMYTNGNKSKNKQKKPATFKVIQTN